MAEPDGLNIALRKTLPELFNNLPDISTYTEESPKWGRRKSSQTRRRTERLVQDPAMRVIVGWRGPEKPAASTNTVSRFETEVLTRSETLSLLDIKESINRWLTPNLTTASIGGRIYERRELNLIAEEIDRLLANEQRTWRDRGLLTRRYQGRVTVAVEGGQTG